MRILSNEDTIIAPATVPGTGAITVIRISGPDALRISDEMVSWRSGNASSSGGGRVKFGSIYGSDGSLLDEVLVSVFRSPHSYTGGDSVEIMCHASPYIASSILELGISKGCRMAQPGEFTQRAFLAGKIDLAQAEAVADLIGAGSASAHRIAMQQLKGGFSDELTELRAALLKMTTLLELELDFSEEDVEFASRNDLASLLDKALGKISALASSFRRGNAIKNGIPVAIVGETNAGKSTLLNAILGEQRAIVSPIAGTTRDTIEECLDIDGFTFRFIDTAGFRKTSGTIEKMGMERSVKSIKNAQIVILLFDASAINGQITDSEHDVPNSLEVLDKVDCASQKLIVAYNKCDLCEGFGTPQWPEITGRYFARHRNSVEAVVREKTAGGENCSGAPSLPPSCVFISAKHSSGISELLGILSDYEKSGREDGSSSVLVSNVRHYEALVTAKSHLMKVRASLGIPQDPGSTGSALSGDLLAEDLRAALSALGSITGEITTDEVLGEIFSRFCIGK